MIINADKPVYLAHTSKVRRDTVAEHLRDVSARAAEYAGPLGVSDEAALAGLLHDLGKYGDLFRRRLQGLEHGIDHWSAGAWVALKTYEWRATAAALAIAGHHVGLTQGNKDALASLDPLRLIERHPLSLRLSEASTTVLLDRLASDGVVLPSASTMSPSICPYLSGPPVAGMSDTRMLYSALVDADFIETEAHFNATSAEKAYRRPGPAFAPARDLDLLLAYLEGLRSVSTASSAVNELRSILLRNCLEAASHETGLFTLTAPTGAGKTLSLFAFALKHAAANGLRRLVVVIPYLTIIDQTVLEYRKALAALGPECLGGYILEDHSLAANRDTGLRPKEETSEGQLHGENWDAPIVITTSVQLLESMFSNRPGACRKLHRLARSVVIFDEVQTLPVNLAVPTLAALSHLSERYKSSVVFSTATQPAFSHLDAAVRRYSPTGWNPREITKSTRDLFSMVRRTEVVWPPELNVHVAWSDVADRLAECRQVLCIVNLKRHAVELFRILREQGVDGIYHLSTNMCPAHRRIVLEEVRQRVDQALPCRLVSTQCVEAGVDLDFERVFRAWGPLDSIAQASGRCNRNGRLKMGTVEVFIPEEEEYPDGAYRQAAGVTRVLWKSCGEGQLDINTPDSFSEYYRELYTLIRPADQKVRLNEAIRGWDFREVADLYRVIPRNAINVLVPFKLDTYHILGDQLERSGLTHDWVTQARPQAVNLYRPGTDDEVWAYLKPAPTRTGTPSDDWFVYLAENHYDSAIGLVTPRGSGCLIA